MWKSWKRQGLAENKTDYSKYRFSWQDICSAFSKLFATGALQGCSTGHGLECWRFQQYGRFYTDATKRTEFKKERKDFPCNLGILS